MSKGPRTLSAWFACLLAWSAATNTSAKRLGDLVFVKASAPEVEAAKVAEVGALLRSIDSQGGSIQKASVFKGAINKLKDVASQLHKAVSEFLEKMKDILKLIDEHGLQSLFNGKLDKEQVQLVGTKPRETKECIVKIFGLSSVAKALSAVAKEISSLLKQWYEAIYSLKDKVPFKWVFNLISTPTNLTETATQTSRSLERESKRIGKVQQDLEPVFDSSSDPVSRAFWLVRNHRTAIEGFETIGDSWTKVQKEAVRVSELNVAISESATEMTSASAVLPR